MEDNINLQKKVRQPQCFDQRKMTSIYQLIEGDINVLNWKMTSITYYVNLAQLAPAFPELSTAQPQLILINTSAKFIKTLKKMKKKKIFFFFFFFKKENNIFLLFPFQGRSFNHNVHSNKLELFLALWDVYKCQKTSSANIQLSKVILYSGCHPLRLSSIFSKV